MGLSNSPTSPAPAGGNGMSCWTRVTGVRSEGLLMMADAERREHSMGRPLAAGFS